jgi:hypothetical protein
MTKWRGIKPPPFKTCTHVAVCKLLCACTTLWHGHGVCVSAKVERSVTLAEGKATFMPESAAGDIPAEAAAMRSSGVARRGAGINSTALVQADRWSHPARHGARQRHFSMKSMPSPGVHCTASSQ